jgi:hypothetical protein
MPLRDHFRPPLSARRHWHAFHNSWATYLSSDLNARLPEGYFAEGNVQFGIEIDVAAFEEGGRQAGGIPPGGNGADAVPGWGPPAPAFTVPLTLLSETVEVLIYASEGGPSLVGAVELVSPANKDRPASRDALVSQCQAYVQQGVGLVLVDVVTERTANLHAELLARLASGGVTPPDADLYAAAYRPTERGGQPSLDVWQEPLAVGQPLPTLPLWLRGGLCLPVELEATYERTCREQRVPANGA